MYRITENLPLKKRALKSIGGPNLQAQGKLMFQEQEMHCL